MAKKKTKSTTKLIIKGDAKVDSINALVDLYNNWFAGKNAKLQESENSRYVSCLSTYIWFLTENKLLDEKRLSRLHKKLLKELKHGKK